MDMYVLTIVQGTLLIVCVCVMVNATVWVPCDVVVDPPGLVFTYPAPNAPHKGVARMGNSLISYGTLLPEVVRLFVTAFV